MKEFGFIGLLDFLGISSLSAEQAEEFIQKRRELLKVIKEEYSAEKVHEMLWNSGGWDGVVGKDKSSIHPDLLQIVPEFQLFGDTVIFILPMKAEYGLPMEAEYRLKLFLFYLCNIWLGRILCWGLNNGYLIRGALAVGEYIHDSYEGSYTVVGPAVSDARAWYEATDWSGIIVTPSCEFALKCCKEGASLDASRGFVKYDVPLTGEGKKELWVVSWPMLFELIHEGSGMSPVGQLIAVLWEKILCRRPAPKGIENKYANTVEFFTWYIEKYPREKRDKELPAMGRMG